ncbi:MAG: peptidylprolyl isomerase [Hyphomicrobiaceae bacterium]|nr:peptidylprolyl isomerase [Hyphomicrobiaceae bacterium]
MTILFKREKQIGQATKRMILAALILTGVSTLSKAQNEPNASVLVEVGSASITAHELEKTLASSPFGVQFNTMNRNEQASLRGVILKRMVASRLLKLDAEDKKIANDKAFQSDIERFRKSLLYKRYMYGLRDSVTLTKDSLKQLMQEFRNKPDALAAARASSLTQRYRTVRVLAIQHLRETYKVRTFEERIRRGMPRNTILLQGNNIGITYGDLLEGYDLRAAPDANWIKERLYQQAEVELVADDALRQGIDVTRQVDNYKRERLPAVLRAQLEKKWINTDHTLKDYYDNHPQIGTIAPRWHIGQLVVATKPEAERLRNAMVNGASLFKMAGRYSIDPYGRAKNGDMGWLRKNKGHPAIIKAIKNLQEGQFSPIVKTSKGYHIITVLDKRESKRLPYNTIIDKVRQTFIDEKMAEYLKDLQKKYKVVWKVIEQRRFTKNDKS